MSSSYEGADFFSKLQRSFGWLLNLNDDWRRGFGSSKSDRHSWESRGLHRKAILWDVCLLAEGFSELSLMRRKGKEKRKKKEKGEEGEKGGRSRRWSTWVVLEGARVLFGDNELTCILRIKQIT